MWKELRSIEISGECSSFLDAIDVWLNKPHVVNRHLCGSKILWQLYSHGYARDDFEELIMTTVADKEEQDNVLMLTKELLKENKQELKLYMRDLLPKSLEKHLILRELVIIDVTNSDAFFMAYSLSEQSGQVVKLKGPRGYRIRFKKENKSLTMYVQDIEDDIQPKVCYTLPWLQYVLLRKIASWSGASKLNTAVTSLRLIQVERYNQLYQELKKKYGIPMVKVWPERTDPQKFVYEDIAIATYLLMIWEEDRKSKGLEKKQSFVDLGCGNGLLVYILTSEGHQGLGLDLRRRKIWDFFGGNFNLQECAITPSSEHLFPEYDWIIGNHSDELTPWIPVIAARSSFHCCYFVLPCCPHDFSAKFNQTVSGISQYRAYLDFVKEVGTACGFQVEEDTLRIPSTKRVCFIGRTRTYQLKNETDVDLKRQNYIEHRCSLASHRNKKRSVGKLTQNEHQMIPVTDKQQMSNIEENCRSLEEVIQRVPDSERKWAADFKPRDSIERPRNCLSVASSIKDHITEVVFNELISMDGLENVQLDDGRRWNAGGSLPLSHVASMFDQNILHQLKNECGGLQTLLRNSHHIFRVQGGHIQLRNWVTDDYEAYQMRKRRKKGKPAISDKKRPINTKLCYFHEHHPQGCPLEAHMCRYAHSQEELITTKQPVINPRN